eukprot:g80842.t1
MNCEFGAIIPEGFDCTYRPDDTSLKNTFAGDQLELLFVTRNTDSTTVFPEKRKQQKRHRSVKNSCLWCSSFIPLRRRNFYMMPLMACSGDEGHHDGRHNARLIQSVIVLMLEDSSIFSSGFLRIMHSVILHVSVCAYGFSSSSPHCQSFMKAQPISTIVQKEVEECPDSASPA